MACCLHHRRLIHVLFLSCFAICYAQTISTNTEIPPLQWINLSSYLQGPAPPPLMDASIGYDNISRNLLIFGGESESGFVQSGTYLLNLDTLVWTTPNPPINLQATPSPRSAALSGDDFAASNRHGHVLIGGRNANTALSDVWEFDYINQFWAEVNISPGGPSPRWGASGGIDIQVAPINDPSGIPGPNNTIYLAGGTDSAGPIAISDIWELHLSGTLSSNLPNSSQGSWQHSPISQLAAFDNQAGTIVGRQVIAAGGCNITSPLNNSCATQEAYVLNTGTNSQIAPGPCPAPRFGAALAQNFNGFSSSFSSQVFLLLGTFDYLMWDDGGGLKMGEVAVLDINAGTWSRILPSGDPGTSGDATFPSPREGAAVLSFSSNLVGSSRTAASDTIVFGGRDASGNYLSEMWLLRAYNEAVSSSNQTWSGFGDGKLQTGVNANGAGVTVQYVTECASAITTPNPSTSSSLPTLTPAASAPGSPSNNGVLYEVSIIHKILAPLSVALLLPAIILLRYALPSTGVAHSTAHNITPLYLSAFIGISAYVLGIAGLASSFTTIKSTVSIRKRSFSDLMLKTAHGKAGLALFIGLYGLVPILYFLRSSCKFLRRASTNDNVRQAQLTAARDNSTDTREKLALVNADSTSMTRSTGNHTVPPSPRRRVPSWAGHVLWHGSQTQEPRTSSDTESTTSMPAGQPRAFEVVNRPQRIRRSSTNTSPRLSRHPGNMDWLERRRSLTAVGELDYALTQTSRTQGTTPATLDMQSQLALMTKATESLTQVMMPHPLDTILHILSHIFVLSLSILSVVALWSLTPRTGFAIFLIWSLAFYVSLFLSAWYGRPSQSILTVIISRLRAPPPVHQPTPSSLPLSSMDQYPFPTEARGPYVHHQPPFRTVGTDEISTTHGILRSADEDEDEDDVDEDIRQQRIEDEMARRDVSIITVPRKKLWIANPESGDLL